MPQHPTEAYTQGNAKYKIFLLFQYKLSNKHRPTVKTTKINQKPSIKVVYDNKNKSFLSSSLYSK